MPASHGAPTRGHAYEPTLVIGSRTISKEQRLELLFSGYVLGELQKALPANGSIVDMDGQVHKIPLAKHYALLDPIIGTLRAWTETRPVVPPPVILNKHCPQCRFRNECVAEAERTDDLSLLERITPKMRDHYHARGIFNVGASSPISSSHEGGGSIPKGHPHSTNPSCKPWHYGKARSTCTSRPH